MRPLFLYGTLRHEPLLWAVAGAVTARPARLAGYAVSWAAQDSYPRIDAAPGAQCDGLLVAAQGEVRARLDFYEGAFGYSTRPVTLEDGTDAEIYWPGPDVPPAGAPFELAQWVARWGELSRLAATEALGHFGRRPSADLPRLMPQIRARAAARLAKRGLPVPRRTGPAPGGPVELLERHYAYADYFAVEEVRLTHPTFAGGRSPEIVRSGFIGGDAVIVLPYDPLRDRVLLVEQIRPMLALVDDPDPFVLEPPAGRIEAGQSPEAAARREAMEEAGVTLGTLHSVAAGYPSPGSSTEFFHLYVGEAQLPDGAAGLGGLDSEDEDIRGHLMAWPEFEAWLDAADFRVLPLMLVGLWLARHRARLRAQAHPPTP